MATALSKTLGNRRDLLSMRIAIKATELQLVCRFAQSTLVIRRGEQEISRFEEIAELRSSLGSEIAAFEERMTALSESCLNCKPDTCLQSSSERSQNRQPCLLEIQSAPLFASSGLLSDLYSSHVLHPIGRAADALPLPVASSGSAGQITTDGGVPWQAKRAMEQALMGSARSRFAGRG